MTARGSVGFGSHSADLDPAQPRLGSAALETFEDGGI